MTNLHHKMNWVDLGIAALGIAFCSVGGIFMAATFSSGISCPKSDFAKQDLSTIQSYPAASEGFSPLVDAKILDKMPMDPWGQAFVYSVAAAKPVVTSFGENGVPGGSNEASVLSTLDRNRS